MPKFPKSFGRRKSTANALEDLENIPVSTSTEPSFKVFERPDGTSRSFDGGVKLAKHAPGRPLTSPKYKEDQVFADIKGNRGSGGSNTNTISTNDNDSSRLSAASTAPSSSHEAHSHEDWKSPHDKPFHDIPLPPTLKAGSAFSLKNAGRTLSWSRNKPTSTPPPPVHRDYDASPEASPPAPNDDTYGRARAVTSSSYASTATPPKLQDRDLGLSMGDDFGSDMFAGIGKQKLQAIESDNFRGMSASPEYYASGPLPRTQVARPSPLNIDKHRQIEPSPYSWSSHHSYDGLMANPSPPPPVPAHIPQTRSTDTLPSAVPRPQRPGGIQDAGLRRTSAFSARRQSTLEFGVGVDEDAMLLRESVNASRRMSDHEWARPSSNDRNKNFAPEEPIPRQTMVQQDEEDDEDDEEAIFEQGIDQHVLEAAALAMQLEEQPISPPMQHTAQMKVMTPAQFERARQDQERLRSVGGGLKDEEDEDEETYDDEEDEAEKNRQLAKQRRKQEAHMAVYRQQMMKMTGEAVPARTQSTPNLTVHGKPEEGEEEDEEVPLAILAAHGFPNKNKPPNPQLSSMGSNPNLRAAAANGSLPVFARNLPQDPYLGAGLVHSNNRESLAFGSASAYSVTPRQHLPQPGGLVGVIANEERSRAARRGSPNTQGDFGHAPSNGFNGMGMSPQGMMQGMGPIGHNPMVLTPGDQAQIQMTQQMQQFMQMQMQFMQIMTSGPGMQQQQQQQQPQVQNAQMPMSQRPGSSYLQGSPNLRPVSMHQQPRAMSMLDPNSAWMTGGPVFAPSLHQQGGGYAPSIAPSERSNVGLPGRYRPVSQMPTAEHKSRTSTMSGALNLQGWENKKTNTTIKVVKTASASDEDDDEGWAEMQKKREQKRSMWKSKRADNGLKQMLHYTH